MNRQEILDEIAVLKERLNKLEKMYDSLTPPNKRWRAEGGECYCYIGTDGMIYWNTEGKWDTDSIRYKFGNYFKTGEEAKFEIERLKVIAELREWATPAKTFDWDVCYDIKYMIILESNEVKVDYFTTFQSSDLYFKTREQAENAIEAVGRERLIKYYFRRGENNANSD